MRTRYRPDCAIVTLRNVNVGFVALNMGTFSYSQRYPSNEPPPCADKFTVEPTATVWLCGCAATVGGGRFSGPFARPGVCTPSVQLMGSLPYSLGWLRCRESPKPSGLSGQGTSSLYLMRSTRTYGV